MTTARATEATEAARQETRAKIKELESSKADRDEVQRLEIVAAILRDNARREIFNAAAPVIVETLKKYAGRPYGPKTAEKIKREIRDRAGVNFWIGGGRYENSASFMPATPEGCNSLNYNYGDFAFHIARPDAAKIGDPWPAFLDADNKITPPASADALRLESCAEYCQDPASRAAEIIEAHKAAAAAAKAAGEAVTKFNNMIPDGIKHLEYIWSVRSWII